MLDTFKIQFDVSTSDINCPFLANIWVDNQCRYQNLQITELHHIELILQDDEQEHELRIELQGKTTDHTKVDADGNIIEDSTINIKSFVIDDIDVNQLVMDKCVYIHDFNGTQALIHDSFHGTAGCNGTISFKFSTPMYLWLLENM